MIVLSQKNRLLKQSLNLFGIFLLILLFFVPFYRVFSVQFVDGHDFLLHFRMIYALEAYLKKGIILPRWLSEATYGYGSPIFTFMWGVPYYLGATLHIIGLNYEKVFKILIILPNVLSGIGFFLWLKPKFGKFVAAVSAIVFIWTPYRFLNSFIRNALGELFFFAFLPYVFLCLDQALSRKKIILGSIFTGLLIYSHQGLSLIGYPLFISYIIFQYWQKKQKKLLLRQIVILIGGLLLTFFYWFPVIIYQSLLPIAEGRAKSLWFPPFWSLVRSRWEGGSIFDGKRLIMSFQLGLLNIGIILTAHIYLLYKSLKKKKIDRQIIFWLLVFWISIFFLQPASVWLWLHIPLILNLQFPFRLLFLPMLTSAITSGCLLSKLRKKLRMITGVMIVLLAVIANRNHLGVLNKEINLNEFASYKGTYDVGGEKLPKYIVLKDIEKEYKEKGIIEEFTIIERKGQIIAQERKDYKSWAKIIMETGGRVKIRRIYFPGWQIYQNGMRLSNFEKGNGIILSLPKGKSIITAEYRDPKLITFSNIISIISLGIFITLLLIK